MLRVVQLRKKWTLGDEIAKGGFGRVFEATGEDGTSAAVKLIPKAPGAKREILFEDLTGVPCVLPILDSGESEAEWVLVMPRAVMSLRTHLDDQRRLTADGAVAILSDIALALSLLKERVVHRDIKPENVLLLDGKWCLSDFGIARYAEAATSKDTHKWALTPAYAAPERWRGSTAGSASDIYSLGVMAFELLTGRVPFPGPDFREQHLSAVPPSPEGCSSSLAGMILECLYKSPQARPTAASLLTRLPHILLPASPNLSALQAANEAEVQRMAVRIAQASAARHREERRREALESGLLDFERIAGAFKAALNAHATAGIWDSQDVRSSSGLGVTLALAKLMVTAPMEARSDAWGNCPPPFEVLAWSKIDLRIPPDRSWYEGRSHSLWFCDAREEGHFGWFETAFMASPLHRRRTRQIPVALAPCEEAGQALSSLMGSLYQVAWPFSLVQSGAEVEVVERWMGWFAQAAQGVLASPQYMPERASEGSWRK